MENCSKCKSSLDSEDNTCPCNGGLCQDCCECGTDCGCSCLEQESSASSNKENSCN